MCIVEELLNETLSMANILKYIDDYSIYSHYIGEELELKKRYSSPLRNGDDNPSFCLYQAGDGIKFKDFAHLPYRGDVFDFVRILMGKGDPTKVSLTSVLRQIDNDFSLGLCQENGTGEKLVPVKVNLPKVRDTFDINITSQPFSPEFLFYWDSKYDIEPFTLDYYHVKNVAVLHYSTKQIKYIVYPKSLCIAYRIGGKYQIYYPFERKDRKFSNNLPANWIFGYLQLKYINDFVIITKAMKEVIFFRQHFDWDTVAGKSENTLIPKHIMQQLFLKYKRVFIWLDSDEAGRIAQQQYLTLYPNLIPISYSDKIEQKDPTDRYEHLKKAGVKKVALQEILSLINNKT